MDARNLPSVERLASDLEEATSGAVARPILVGIARDAIEAARHTVAAGGAVDPSGLGRDLALRLARSRPQRIINATGVLLHTTALQAEGYGNVAFDLVTGSRGTRAGYLHTLLASLTGAEAALVVNNNAAALLLALAALAAPGNVVVSRGELIEIGGTFRLPTLMAASGAAMVEVGTTNRTRLADYSEVVSDAGILLKIHPSNYRIEGFVEAVDWRDLAALAGEHDVPFVADVGSGLLDTRTPWLDGPPPAWIEGEPGVRQTIEQGAGIVLFSGDKLLGGPQAGLVVGRRPWVETMRRHPLARALRIDAPTTASLTTTLEHYAAGAGNDIPFWRMASLSYTELEVRHAQVLAAAGIEGVVVESASVPGAGSVPGAAIPSPALQLAADPDAAWRRLAAAPVAIIGRRHEGACLIDLRTVDPDDDPAVIDALRAL
jgi:L-seryl-tRNA(Ser) seleniumtransferase